MRARLQLGAKPPATNDRLNLLSHNKRWGPKKKGSLSQQYAKQVCFEIDLLFIMGAIYE